MRDQAFSSGIEMPRRPHQPDQEAAANPSDRLQSTLQESSPTDLFAQARKPGRCNVIGDAQPVRCISVHGHYPDEEKRRQEARGRSFPRRSSKRQESRPHVWKQVIDHNGRNARAPLDERLFQFRPDLPSLPTRRVVILPPEERPRPSTRQNIEDENGPPIGFRQRSFLDRLPFESRAHGHRFPR